MSLIRKLGLSASAGIASIAILGGCAPPPIDYTALKTEEANREELKNSQLIYAGKEEKSSITEITDLNLDGLNDIVIDTCDYDRYKIIANMKQADGAYARIELISLGARYFNVSDCIRNSTSRPNFKIAESSDDKFPDLIVSARFGNQTRIYVFENSGIGTFESAPDFGH